MTFVVFLVIVVGSLGIVIPQIYESIKKIIGDIPQYYKEIEKWVKQFLEDNNEVSTYVLGILDNSYERLSNYINDIVIPNADQIVKGITSVSVRCARIRIRLELTDADFICNNVLQCDL